jgi:hypothetical protein
MRQDPFIPDAQGVYRLNESFRPRADAKPHARSPRWFCLCQVPTGYLLIGSLVAWLAITALGVVICIALETRPDCVHIGGATNVTGRCQQ